MTAADTAETGASHSARSRGDDGVVLAPHRPQKCASDARGHGADAEERSVKPRIGDGDEHERSARGRKGGGDDEEGAMACGRADARLGEHDGRQRRPRDAAKGSTA